MIGVERKLFLCFFLSTLFLLFSLVSFSVPWGHWSYTLDRCPGENCGCFLYGRAYYDLFTGGRIEYCQFVTFGQVPLVVVGIILTFYHGIRAFVLPRRAARESAWRGNPLLSGSRRKKSVTEKDLAQFEPEPPSVPGIICLVVTACLGIILLLTIFGFFLDGYLKSCDEYRRFLVKNLHASGRFAYIINNRLICMSVFDFMDYLQPDRKHPDVPFESVRRDRINTGLSLLFAKFGLIFAILAWMRILYHYCRLLIEKARKSS